MSRYQRERSLTDGTAPTTSARTGAHHAPPAHRGPPLRAPHLPGQRVGVERRALERAPCRPLAAVGRPRGRVAPRSARTASRLWPAGHPGGTAWRLAPGPGCMAFRYAPSAAGVERRGRVALASTRRGRRSRPTLSRPLPSIMKLAAVGKIENAANFMIDAGWGLAFPSLPVGRPGGTVWRVWCGVGARGGPVSARWRRGTAWTGALRAGNHGVPATPLAARPGCPAPPAPTPSRARPLSIKELTSAPRLPDDPNPLVNLLSAARTHPVSPILELWHPDSRDCAF
ncbi:hypothetical protein GA0070213_101536 [Micromonospora humi]|uniref:Uncharacterized protein n=1 Tax=Micromonospora humi TaxID=745366 RepID=A0A1C5GTI8_9ACTN|nr:hypothetical protein GA0070213_101536 [Micromonospora humi]